MNLVLSSLPGCLIQNSQRMSNSLLILDPTAFVLFLQQSYYIQHCQQRKEAKLMYFHDPSLMKTICQPATVSNHRE